MPCHFACYFLSGDRRVSGQRYPNPVHTELCHPLSYRRGLWFARTTIHLRMVSKSIDSLNVLLKAQNLEGDLKIQLNEIKTLASKGYSPALKVSVDKAVGILSNIGDATKKKDGNQ